MKPSSLIGIPRAVVAGAVFLLVLGLLAPPQVVAKTYREIGGSEGDPGDGFDNDSGSSGGGTDEPFDDFTASCDDRPGLRPVLFLPGIIWSGYPLLVLNESFTGAGIQLDWPQPRSTWLERGRAQ